MVTISNEFLTAAFSEIGAELKSLKSDNREYIWNGDPAFWTGSSPVLFPICGFFTPRVSKGQRALKPKQVLYWVFCLL